MSASGASSLIERFSPGARALLGILRSSGAAAGGACVQELHPQIWDEVLEIALGHGVAPLLHRALHTKRALDRVPRSVLARIEEERRTTALDNLRNYGQFQRVARALRERGIPVLALKGLHLAELVYRDIGVRPMADMDILVPRPQLEQAISALHVLNFKFAKDQDLLAAAGAMLDIKCNIGFAHHYVDVWVEVHWSLAEPPARYVDVLDAIWHSAVPARLGDADTSVMSPEFLLLHVCAHLACNHTFAFSLRALCDVAEIVRAHPGIDWNLVIDHGRRHGWGRGIAAALRLASDHLGAAVPADVLVALGADTLDQGMLAEAMEHLLTCIDMPDELRTAPNLIALASKRGPLKKIAALWHRIFVPRAELALRYGVPGSPVHLAVYYAARLRDLLRRYAAVAWALNVSDPSLAATAARHARLENWINGA